MTPSPLPRPPGRILRLLLVLAAVGGIVMIAPAPAMAHPSLLYTTPAAETADPAAPSSIVLVFGEPVTVAANAVTVADVAGAPVRLDAPVLAKQGHAVTAAISQTLPAGVYTVAWRVTGADGDLVEGRFRFAVGATITTPSTVDSGNGEGEPWPVTVLRFVLLAGLTLATGGLIIGLLVWRARKVNPALPEVDSLGGIGAIAGAAAAAALSVRYAAQSADLDTPATIAAVQAAAFVLIVVAQALRRNGITALALAAITVAEGLRAHPHVALPGSGAVLTFIHVAAAALWAGTLAHVVRTGRVWRAHPGAVRWLLYTYARMALWAAATVVVTGCLAALLLAPPQAWATTSYGRLLLAKTALVLAAAILAFAARRILGHGNNPALPVLRPARAEAMILGVVLVVTAMLTTTAPPARDPAAGQLPPPAPAGQVLPLGTLAGQIGVAVEASARRLVVRLSAPSRDDYYTTTPARQRFSLTGRLLTAAGEPADLNFRGCGNGCYLTNVAWGAGDNLLTLRPAADGWKGGTISLVVPWPVTDGTTGLTQAVAAMRTLAEVRFTETVTSNTSQPTGEPAELRLPAQEFLALQPYGSGQATHTALLPSGDGRIRLALGYPAEGRYIQLTLDSQHRIIDEIQSDPKHLTIRHYLY